MTAWMQSRKDARDWLCEGGALELARRIRAYWAGEGRYVEVWVEPLAKVKARGEEHGSLVWAVRSNIGGWVPHA